MIRYPREMKQKSVTFRNLAPDIPSTTHATFGLYKYPAKFIPQVIAYALKTYARPGMRVFGPFAGYGRHCERRRYCHGRKKITALTLSGPRDMTRNDATHWS